VVRGSMSTAIMITRSPRTQNKTVNTVDIDRAVARCHQADMTFNTCDRTPTSGCELRLATSNTGCKSNHPVCRRAAYHSYNPFSVSTGLGQRCPCLCHSCDISVGSVPSIGSLST
jgi:hypothetical protein